jgi:hypothetical protein
MMDLAAGDGDAMSHGKPDPTRELAPRAPLRRREHDLLCFFTRHGATYVPMDRLAACMGYAREDVERGLEALVAAGIVRRRSGRTPGISLYRVGAAPATGSPPRDAPAPPDAPRAARLGVDIHDIVTKSAAARARAAVLSARVAHAVARAGLLLVSLETRRAELRRLLSTPTRPPRDRGGP